MSSNESPRDASGLNRPLTASSEEAAVDYQTGSGGRRIPRLLVLINPKSGTVNDTYVLCRISGMFFA